MATVKLEKLELENFKGVGSLTIEPDGQSFDIVGENGTGKTTIMDAFLWLLFDEDLSGQSKFDVKTLKESGDPKHDLDHRVKGWINFGGDVVELEKVYSEKKDRDGHETDYKFAGVERTKTEYEKRINDRVDLEKLRVLVDPHYFNENMGKVGWKKRREMLVDVFGRVQNDEVIEENPDLEEFDLNGLDPEERRDQIKSQKREVKEQRGKLEERIKERNSNPPDNGIDDIESARKNLDGLKEKEQKIRDEISEIKASDPKAEIQREVRDVKDELHEVERNWRSGIEEQIRELKSERGDVLDDLSSLSRTFESLSEEKKRKREQIEELSEKRDRLREEYYEIKDRMFDPDQKICPTCGQELPEEEVDENRHDFNQQKTEDLKRNKEKGMAAKQKQEQLEEDVEEIQADMAEAVEDIHGQARQLRALEEQITDKESELDGYEDEEKYQELEDEKEQLEEKLEQEDFGPSEKLEEKRTELEEITAEIDDLQEKINEFEHYLTDQDKVRELKDREESLAVEIERLERQEILADEFINTKIELLEGKINDHFDLVDFRLFEPYATKDGVKPTCETLVNGVKYSSTLNKGAKPLAGIDIIKTFSREFGIRAPLFIDDAEKLTEFPEIDLDTQIIRAFAVVVDDYKQGVIEKKFTNPTKLVEGETVDLLDDRAKKPV